MNISSGNVNKNPTILYSCEFQYENDSIVFVER